MIPVRDRGTLGQITKDAFLDGRLRLNQPRLGYRAGIDPVLLAASVEARPGQSVLDLGCGVGTALFCVGQRVPDLRLTGLELQPDYAALARRNAAENGLPAEILTGDIAQMPATLRARRFDHVIANPPYFDRAGGTEASDYGRETALGEALPLEHWIAAASRRTAPGGDVTFIHRAERLPELLAGFAACLGSLRLLPLIPRDGRDARLVLIRGHKGGRGVLRLCTPWILHSGDAHDGDRENYTKATASILRDGAALPMQSRSDQL